MTTTSKVALLVLLLGLACNLLLEAEAQFAAKSVQNPCVSKQSCHECIQTKSCAWCMQPDYGDKPRCFQPSNSNTCAEQYIYNPDTELKFIVNRALKRASYSASTAGGQMGFASSYESNSTFSSSAKGSFNAERGSSGYGRISSSGSSYEAGSSSQIVQISPQRVSLKLRINQVHSLPLQYSQAEDYPVDLYYLMDLSNSMADDKKSLSKLGQELSDTMRNITSNFRLGFGSFVDKVLMPFVSTIPKKLEHPCEKCEAPYGYHNHMPLSNDTSEFASLVSAAPVSGNLDSPEGGFDAIMQSIVCRKDIGWREQARRLLVFSTDAGFHYAGDGKLAGVIEPNDGECHMNQNGYYTHSTIQDFPSIAQINQKVKENSINIIFAVTQSQHGVYEKLSKHVEGSSSAILSGDSSNVVELVRQEYNKITSSIEMKDNATSNVKISYHSACLSGGAEVATSRCEGLKVGDVVNFTAQILVTTCPQDKREWNQIVQIYPVGINESLIIDLEMLCSCPCEHPGSLGYEDKSPKCNGHGNLMCGICECDQTHIGHNCECSASDVNLSNENVSGCRADNITQIDCSGQGNCLCGVCECVKRPNREEIISGKYCECNNFSCDRNGQQLCSGPDHGNCECGICNCKSGWSGTACECKTSNETCISPNGNGELCSGHGECICGECKCKITDEGRYSGKFCENCPTCAKRCTDLKDCVQCQMFKNGPLKDTCHENCTAFTPIPVEKIDAAKDELVCTFYDEDDCKFYFKYAEEGDKLMVYAQEERECPPKVFMLGIVLGVIAAIVLIGLAILLLWKLLTTIHDRREFARFEKERMNAKWDTGENPIYKQATSTFKNPMYAGK